MITSYFMGSCPIDRLESKRTFLAGRPFQVIYRKDSGKDNTVALDWKTNSFSPTIAPPNEESWMSLKVWIDGKLLDKENAKISVYDHGLLYGDGVFEGIRVY